MKTIEQLENVTPTEMVKKALSDNQMNMSDLARKLDMQVQAISNIVHGTGKRVFTIELAVKLEKLFPQHISAKELLISQLLVNYNSSVYAK